MERAINSLKQSRAVAARCDECGYLFLGDRTRRSPGHLTVAPFHGVGTHRTAPVSAARADHDA
ncbi:hypothetical protein [Streptomyces europaeiscabiei]|uniref:hypothetical protein n=1 Tax=Streptomyces europaeiscabiei TaxID=146819 RepID=UPI0007659A6D|nr:hypothetical protein [Streptomyces europaeiscabiei]MDX2760115.1 hypothetical protein [Streptomyces europaeiscabiei]MDX2767564.1 hypothetical protein [Streptomyces europaeiscabiei]MDX3666041.1 hypothetical protein [Streptomyces europaeiscabiei]MDX3715293.1 hypothetical protein [Streptomyces europaeiscabiei]MDX3781921.1 hypothetical protein [Streptomyces europaeiscabiei]